MERGCCFIFSKDNFPIHISFFQQKYHCCCILRKPGVTQRKKRHRDPVFGAALESVHTPQRSVRSAARGPPETSPGSSDITLTRSGFFPPQPTGFSAAHRHAEH